MSGQKRKAAQQLPAAFGTFLKCVAVHDLPDPALKEKNVQLALDRLFDGPACTAGTVSMNQGTLAPWRLAVVMPASSRASACCTSGMPCSRLTTRWSGPAAPIVPGPHEARQ